MSVNYQNIVSTQTCCLLGPHPLNNFTCVLFDDMILNYFAVYCGIATQSVNIYI